MSPTCEHVERGICPARWSVPPLEIEQGPRGVHPRRGRAALRESATRSWEQPCGVSASSVERQPKARTSLTKKTKLRAFYAYTVQQKVYRLSFLTGHRSFTRASFVSVSKRAAMHGGVKERNERASERA